MRKVEVFKKPANKLKLKEHEVTYFMPYKPKRLLSAKEINEEILSRTRTVSYYTNELNKTFGDERKFIEERIKWNNERIALLLG